MHRIETAPEDGVREGLLCWVGLATRDTAAVAPFYQELFGWQTTDLGMDGAQVFTLGGEPVGIAYAQTDAARAAATPPHWTCFVSVSEMNEGIERVRSMGGRLLREPFAAIGESWIAPVMDPAGGTVSLWQSAKQPRVELIGEAGTWCGVELVTPNVEASKAFYAAVFGWEFDPGIGHSRIRRTGPIEARIRPGVPSEPAGWIPAFGVKGLSQVLAERRVFGQPLLHFVRTLGSGDWVELVDPAGAAFSIVGI